MKDHEWICDVLHDLADYCRQNGLERTEDALKVSQTAFLSDSLDLEPQNLRLENHLALANGRPVIVEKQARVPPALGWNTVSDKGWPL